jgi:CheY-like chemotaxis protein
MRLPLPSACRSSCSPAAGSACRRVKTTRLTARLNKPVRTTRLYQHLKDILLPAVPTTDAVSPIPNVVGRRPLRVLLAEDNVVNQRLARLVLEKLSHHVDIVGNGLEAADAVHLVPYDVVLLDVEMPVMDGMEATRLIRTTEPIQRQPEIVAMTASALVDDKRACYEAGMDDYLAKPVRLQELNAALERAADKIRAKEPNTGNGAESSRPTSG